MTVIWSAEGIMPFFPRPWWWRFNKAAWERRLRVMVAEWQENL